MDLAFVVFALAFSPEAAPSLAVFGCGAISTYSVTKLRAGTRLYRTGVECVVAIHEFRKAKGRLPKSVAELVPEFAAVPHIDSFSGKPLVYRVTDDRDDFKLYSVGTNQVDDGGVHEGELADDGDLVFWPPPVPEAFPSDP